MVRQVKIAIIDNGIDEEYLDYCLKGKFYIDENCKCIIDNKDMGNVNFIHGTICASIVQKAHSGIEIYSIRILDKNGKGFIKKLKPAFEWCLKEKIMVVNLSLGTTYFQDKDVIKQIINYYANQGMCIIAATANSRYTTYPASFTNVVAVAVDNDCVYNSFPMIDSLGLDVLAPVDHKMEFMGIKCDVQQSNSYAAPFVTALAAKLYHWKKGISIAEIKNTIQKQNKKGITVFDKNYHPDWVSVAWLQISGSLSQAKYYFNVVGELDGDDYDTVITDELTYIDQFVKLQKHIIYLGKERLGIELNDRFFWSPQVRIDNIMRYCSVGEELDIPIILCEFDNGIDDMFLLTELRNCFGDAGHNIFTVSLKAESVLYDLEYIPPICLAEKDRLKAFIYWQTYCKQSDGIIIGVEKLDKEILQELFSDIDIMLQIYGDRYGTRMSIYSGEEMLSANIYSSLDSISISNIAQRIINILTEEEHE